MKAFFSKYWPSFAHVAGVAVVFLTPSVQGFLGSHPAYAATLGAAWGIALHWATSPKQ